MCNIAVNFLDVTENKDNQEHIPTAPLNYTQSEGLTILSSLQLISPKHQKHRDFVWCRPSDLVRK